MTPEVKYICNSLIEEHCVFEYEDAVHFCDDVLKGMQLCIFEYADALHYIMIGLDVECNS